MAVPRLNLIAAHDLMATAYEPPKWIVPGLIPEGLTLLAGRPKLGKSWLAMNISLSVAAMVAVLGREPGDAGDVLHLALEDGPRRLQQRLGMMLGAGKAPTRLSFATNCPALDDGGADAIRAWATSVPNPRLVVVDVFQRIRSKPKQAARLYADDYEAVLPLKAIADELGIGILVVTHCRKSDAHDDPLDAVSATTGLTGAADHILILDRDQNGTALYGRGRDVEEFDIALRFDPMRGLWSALGDRGAIMRSDSRNSILEALRDAATPMTPKAIADASGVGHDVAKKLCSKMTEAGDLIKVGNGSYSLPTPIPSVPPVPSISPLKSMKGGGTGNGGNKGNGGTVGRVTADRLTGTAA